MDIDQRRMRLGKRTVMVLGGAAVMTTAGTLLAAGLSSPARAASPVTITIKGGACSGGGSAFCFSPESVVVGLGATVTWVNQSGVGHTASSCTSTACPGAPANTGKNTFSVSIGAAAGSSGSFTFTSAGTYTYYCMIHGYSLMHGKLTVVGAPHITSFMPASGAPGTVVTISGNRLAHASSVTFNGTRATIDSDKSATITATVPAGATTGRIAVTTPGGTATSAADFTVT